jgi:cytochrome c556
MMRAILLCALLVVGLTPQSAEAHFDTSAARTETHVEIGIDHGEDHSVIDEAFGHCHPGLDCALAALTVAGIVKERMVAMSAMGDFVKAAAPMKSGAAAYNPAAVRHTAETIGKRAGDAMTWLFPEENENMASYVNNAIWEDWDAFAELAEQLHTYSEDLALAAGNGLEGQQSNMAESGAMMGGSSMMGADGIETADMMGREELAEMPADAVFAMMSNTCSSCQTRFRTETK